MWILRVIGAFLVVFSIVLVIALVVAASDNRKQRRLP